MKIQLLSDLHLEFKDLDKSITTGADVIVLAGDIHKKANAIPWINENIPTGVPVIYVLGNHEFYRIGRSHQN